MLYSIAVCQRHLQQIDAALTTLAALEAFHPGYSRLFQERGYCRIALRDAPGAIDSLLQAVNRNPALPGSWSALGRLYTMTGDSTNAKIAAAHVATMASLPVPIVTANSMFADQELVPAEQLVRAYLLKHGDHIEGMRLLARIGMERDVLDDAEVLLAAVVKMAPDYLAARLDYANVLLRRQRYPAALHELKHLCALEPINRAFRTSFAAALVGLGQHEQALALYQSLLQLNPHGADLQLSVGHCLKTLGRTTKAIDAYREAVRLRPVFGDAYWSLANLKTYRFTDSEMLKMRAAHEAREISRTDRVHLYFALGKALEDREQYGESFDFYSHGNALKREGSQYRPESIEANTSRQIRSCNAELFRRNARTGCQDSSPIFIVGLPRSGSTLIEQILASHSQIEGTMELADIPRIVHELQGSEANGDRARYPQILNSMRADELTKLGERYVHDTGVFRSGKPFFIDKMPNNFRHLGLIHLILPRAKIIDARREPMACCFSNFKQLFSQGQEFTYSLMDIGRYYRTYVELLRHWDEVLPGKVLRVQHETLLGDFESQTRRMFEFLEVEFEPQCLQFYRTERSVRTASSEQVRQPITSGGIDHWRHFDPWLAPLREALGPLAELQ